MQPTPIMIVAIDCTHVSITASLGENEGDFVNHKLFHSNSIQERDK